MNKAPFGGRLFITAIVCIIPLALSSAPGPALAVPSSESYSNLASAALLNRAQEVSRALTAAGFLPTESFTNVSIDLEGQSTHPSARVKGSCCVYGFRQGLLNTIRRMDLFEDKGPASLILPHLTNEVLALTPGEAMVRAMQVLQLLSYPTNRIEQLYRISVHDDLMDAHPVRNGGPNFPEDLHFFGELISRKKIKIMVEIAPGNPELFGETGDTPPGTRIEFLATTGELLNAMFLPDDYGMSRLEIHGPEQITIRATADFAAPVFISSTRRISPSESVATTIPIESLLREAWADLLQKLGTNRPKCILVCDNLNNPHAVATAMRDLAAEIPWAGVSHLFRLDLPFEPAQLERLAQHQRGVSLLGIYGGVETRFDALPGLTANQRPADEDLATPEGQAKWKQFYDDERQRLAPSVEDLLNRIEIPETLPDHAIFLFQAAMSTSSRIVEEQLQSRFRGKAQVFSVMGTSDYWSVGDGFTYLNGQILTNGMVILSMSGSLPLQQDINHLMALRSASFTNSPNFDPEKLRLLQTRGPTRIISGEVINPIRQLAYAFGPHPLEDVVAFFGLEEIKMLQEAEKLEVFEIKSGRFGASPTAGSSFIEGYEVVAQGKTLGHEAAHGFASALLTEKNGIRAMSSCGWQPVIVFRAWRDKEQAALTVCFQCNESVFTFYDASGKRIRQTHPFSFAGRQELLRLARQALPSSVALAGIK
jgi:hypothetical protein